MTAFKAITLHEPWATFIADGIKRYETRSWKPSIRQLAPDELLMIHAGKKWDKAQRHTLENLLRLYPEVFGKYAAPDYEFPLGSIVCACRFVKWHPVEEIRGMLSPVERVVGGYGDGRYAWKLEVLRVADPPIAAKGMQGIWRWYNSE